MKKKAQMGTGIMVIFMLIILTFVIYIENQNNKVELEKYNKTMVNGEARCYDFCDGEYYFASGGLFASDTCTCKQIGEKNEKERL